MKNKKNKVSEIKLNTTQKRVFDYMLDFGSITSMQACFDLGETRLSARIFELKEKGVNISYNWKSVKNRYGETRHIKQYFIG